MAPPRWATLERQLLAENVPASREFFRKYFDERGYLQVFVRWGANDGPDDAFENFNRWPELHALGASDEILQMYSKGHEGLIKQYTEAKTTDVPIARQGMYYKEFIVQSDWMHHGEGMQLFNRMALSVPADPTYQARARRFAGFYMGEDPEAPNYDAAHKIIRSMQNGSRGPMLRKATALDWVGDPFDPKPFVAEHGESTFEQFLAHYEEYGDVVGDHFLNLVATVLPTNAYLVSGESEVPDVGARIHGRLAGPHEAERRHHSQLRRSRRPHRRSEGRVVEERVRVGIQPGQPGHRQARGPQPHPARSDRLQQRPDDERRSEVRRCVAHDDGRRERARARGRTGRTAVPDDVRRRRLVRLARYSVERRGAGALVLVAEAAGSRADRPQPRGSDFCRGAMRRIPTRRCNAISA